MKKTLTRIGAGAILALATFGCGKEKVVEQQPDTITFSAVVGKQTATSRAKEFGYWQAGETLDVISYMTGAGTSAYIPFHLTYNGPYTTSWTYSPLVEISKPPFSRTYYAYYPANANISNATFDGTDGSFDYTVREAAANEDLVAAKTVTAYARVPLMFHHLLSQINFAVQGIRGVHLDIRNIKLSAIANSAHYTFSPPGGTWSTPVGTAEYPYTPLATVTFPTDGNSSDIIYLGNKGGNSPLDNDNTNALMLMPQSFEPGLGGYFSFEYAITDMNNQPMKSGNAKVYLGAFTTKTWEPGKRYLYLLDLTGLIEEGPITFEVIVFGWSDAMQNIAQPVIIADGSQLLIEKAISAQNTEKANIPSLRVFPISLPNSPMSGGPNDKVVLTSFAYDNFTAGDQVRILCFSYENAIRIELSPTLSTAWTLVAPTSPNTEVVLIKK